VPKVSEIAAARKAAAKSEAAARRTAKPSTPLRESSMRQSATSYDDQARRYADEMMRSREKLDSLISRSRSSSPTRRSSSYTSRESAAAPLSPASPTWRPTANDSRGSIASPTSLASPSRGAAPYASRDSVPSVLYDNPSTLRGSDAATSPPYVSRDSLSSSVYDNPGALRGSVTGYPAAASLPYAEGRVLTALRSDLKDLDRGVRHTSGDFDEVQTQSARLTSSVRLQGDEQDLVAQTAAETASDFSNFSVSSTSRREYDIFHDDRAPRKKSSRRAEKKTSIKKNAFLLADDGVLREEGSDDAELGLLAAAAPLAATTARGPRRELGESRNVFLLFRLQTLRMLSIANVILAVLALAFVGLNLVMVALNFLNHNDAGCDDPDSKFVARCGSPVSIWTFHIVEFSGNFFFSLVQASALLCTPRSTETASIYGNPNVLRLVLVFSVLVSLVPTLLIWFNIEVFEVPAHEIEYGNEVTMSFIDIILFTALMRKQNQKSKLEADADAQDNATGLTKAERRAKREEENKKSVRAHATPDAKNKNAASKQGQCSMTMAYAACGVALVQLYVYNGLGITDDGERNGEKPAHYLEFVFEVISAFITFWFCVSTR